MLAAFAQPDERVQKWAIQYAADTLAQQGLDGTASLSAPNESLARMRKLVPERQPPGTMMSPLSPGAPKPPVVEPPLLVKAVEALKKKPIVAYFVAELAEVKSRTLFAQCQPLIWAVEGPSVYNPLGDYADKQQHGTCLSGSSFFFRGSSSAAHNPNKARKQKHQHTNTRPLWSRN
ncbi:nucleoporin NDC1 [Ixodes scapularis]